MLEKLKEDFDNGMSFITYIKKTYGFDSVASFESYVKELQEKAAKYDELKKK